MGFLGLGQPILWSDLTDEVRTKVRLEGLKQLVHIWSVNEGRSDGPLYWGDEVEFTVVHLDHEREEARIVLEAPRILKLLKEKEEANDWDERLLCCKRLFLKKAKKTFLRGSEWHPECCNHVIEATPSPPYPMSVEGLLDIEESMVSRRLKLQEVLCQEFTDVYALSVTTLPNFGIVKDGAADYVYPGEKGELLSDLDVRDFLGQSCTVIKRLPNPHPRFPTLCLNTDSRRGTKVSGLFPVESTEDLCWAKSLPAIPPNREAISEQSKQTQLPVKGYAYGDNFASGMSMCCLQVTFGSHNIQDSLYLYDQMVVLAPIFLALSAATPALFGHVSDYDTRWKVLEQTCDCRTDEELKRIPQSRFGCAPMFISDDDFLREHEAAINDVLLPIDASSYQALLSGRNAARASGHPMRHFSDRVMRHFATLWLRDPLVIFEDKINLDNKCNSDHFENIQSSNWNSVRFKLPPPSGDGHTPAAIGWRVELRTPDVQLSDFQNAAMSGILSLIAMAIHKEHWNFYVPISQVRQNMESASKKGSCIAQKFWWPSNQHFDSDGAMTREGVDTTPRSLASIFLDEQDGLLRLLDRFVSNQWRQQACSCEAVQQYRVYAAFIKNRVLGREPTNASTLRRLMDYTRGPVASECAAVDSPTSTVASPVRNPFTMSASSFSTCDSDKLIPSTPSASFEESDLPRINHKLNYQLMKYAILAGYDRDVLMTSQEVHSLMQSTPFEVHICNKSRVLMDLTKLLPGTLPSQLPEHLVIKKSNSSGTGDPSRGNPLTQQGSTEKNSAAETQLSSCCL